MRYATLMRLGLLTMVLGVLLSASSAVGEDSLQYPELLMTYKTGNYPSVNYSGWWERTPVPANVTKDLTAGLVKIAWNNQQYADFGWGVGMGSYVGYPAGPKFNVGVRVVSYIGKWGTSISDADRWLAYHEGNDNMASWLGYARTSYSFVLNYGVPNRVKFSCGRKTNGSGGWVHKQIVTIPVANINGSHTYAVEVNTTSHKAYVFFDNVLVGSSDGYDASIDAGFLPANSQLAWGAYASTSSMTYVDFDDFWLVDGPVLMKGDVNLDGAVTQADMDIVVANQGKARPTRGQGDLNGDNLVDGADITEVNAYMGRSH